jgi:hypothetical protein
MICAAVPYYDDVDIRLIDLDELALIGQAVGGTLAAIVAKAAAADLVVDLQAVTVGGGYVIEVTAHQGEHVAWSRTLAVPWDEITEAHRAAVLILWLNCILDGVERHRRQTERRLEAAREQDRRC